MKKISFALVATTIFLTACSQQGEVELNLKKDGVSEVEMSGTNVESVEESTDTNNKSINNGDNSTSNQIVNYEVDEEKLYLGDLEPIPASFFEPHTELNIGESMELNSGFSVTLEKYEIVEDMNGSGLKGILFLQSRTNTSDEPITVGRNGESIATVFYAYYNELFLLSHELSEAEEKIDPHYQEVKINYEMDGIETCSENVTISPGETNSCYNLISFAGNGKYECYSLIYERDENGGQRANGSRKFTININ